MEHYLRDDENHFLIERLQNRKIRLELGRLKTQNLDMRENYEQIFENERFTFGNTTPPSNTQQYHYLFFNNYKDLDTPVVDYSPHTCPICFEMIWRDTNIIECFNCSNIFCQRCYNTMRESSMHHEKNLNCPLCRAVLVQYYSAETFNIENDVENQNNTAANPAANLRANPAANPAANPTANPTANINNITINQQSEPRPNSILITFLVFVIIMIFLYIFIQLNA